MPDHPSDSFQSAALVWEKRAVWFALVVYCLAFAAFFPDVLTVADEASYAGQALAFSRGSLTLPQTDPFTMLLQDCRPSDYPPGTSALMAPMMLAFGWRGMFLLGAACLVTCVLLLARWLALEGKSPLFALIVLAYPPTLVISRCGMSDLPSAALITLGLFCFWRGGKGPILFWLAAGVIAGASLMLRETNPLLFGLFFAGALARREENAWALVLGGLLGVALRMVAAWAVYGDPLYIKPSYPGFSLAAIGANAHIYLVALLLMVPGGLLFGFLYRGPRRPELLATLSLFVLVHLLYDYNASSSGGLKQWILAPRFLIPLLPLLAFAMAESTPRLWVAALAKLRVAKMASGGRVLALTRGISVCAVAVLATLVNWQHSNWATSQRSIVSALYSASDPDAPVLTNLEATGKFFHAVYTPALGSRLIVDSRNVTSAQIRQLLARHTRVKVALLQRNDSEHWKQRSLDNEVWLKSLGQHFDTKISTTQPVTGNESILLAEIQTLR